jgi:hypothetical protein
VKFVRESVSPCTGKGGDVITNFSRQSYSCMRRCCRYTKQGSTKHMVSKELWTMSMTTSEYKQEI